mgnify:CR=1 FL=1
MYKYRCKLKKVVDGDTVDIDIDLGFEVWLKNQRVRLYGVDTPESRTRDKEEKKYGLAAKQFVENFLDDKWLILQTETYDATGKFGRILGSLYRTTNYANQSLNEYLIEKHHAVPYYGQSKEDIQKQHLENRKFVNLTEKVI